MKRKGFNLAEGTRRTGWGKCSSLTPCGDKNVQPLRRGEVAVVNEHSEVYKGGRHKFEQTRNEFCETACREHQRVAGCDYPLGKTLKDSSVTLFPQNDELRHCEEDVSPTKQSSLFCHSELTRKLVELAKRNFLFLLGDSKSIKRQTLKQVQGDNNFSGLPRRFAPRNDGGINNRKELINSSTYQLIHFKKSAFTLAEVLITIGVIGVVAAMTIPALMANIKGLRNRAQFKKTLSTLNQAVRMNKANYDWDFSNLELINWRGDIACQYILGDNFTASDVAIYTPDVNKSICSLINGSLKGGKFIKSSTSYILDINDYNIEFPFYHNSSRLTPSYQMADGTILYFGGPHKCELPIGISLTDAFKGYPTTYTDTLGDVYETTGYIDLINNDCGLYIDVNGFNGPNKEIRCSNDVKTDLTPDTPCVVKNSDITDIFPVVFHDDIVEPATNAAKYVLNTAK
ncbi:type II secretion system protein [bacterium]|nr:type II secretion system protein [bacterium]